MFGMSYATVSYGGMIDTGCRLFPYHKKDSPFGDHQNVYSKKDSPFGNKTEIYTKKNSPFVNLSDNCN